MSTSNISVQLYTVRESLESDIAGTLKRLHSIGFTNVELFAFLQHVETYEAALASTGMRAPSAHARLIDHELGAIFDAAQRLGVGTVIDPDIPADRWTTREDIERSAADLNAVARRAADFGLMVGYHNHSWEVRSLFGSTTGLEIFADSLDDGVVLEVDTFWVEVGGVSSIELLRRLGERVQFLHVKDGPLTEDPDDQVGLGKGPVDVRGILAAAPQALRVVELDGTRADLFTELADSFTFLQPIVVAP